MSLRCFLLGGVYNAEVSFCRSGNPCYWPEPAELRGFLQSGRDVLTETWSNIFSRALIQASAARCWRGQTARACLAYSSDEGRTNGGRFEQGTSAASQDRVFGDGPSGVGAAWWRMVAISGWQLLDYELTSARNRVSHQSPYNDRHSDEYRKCPVRPRWQLVERGELLPVVDIECDQH